MSAEEPKDGTTMLAVGERDGNVILSFPKPVAWCILDPETAKNVGEAMAREAYKIYTGLKYEGQSVISDQKRERILINATFDLIKLLEKNAKPNYIAQAIVDKVLQEVI